MREYPFPTAATVGLAAIVPPTGPSWAVDSSRLENAAKNPNDWLLYRRSHDECPYSPLDQIDTTNVKDLKVAWTHTPGRATHGL